MEEIQQPPALAFARLGTPFKTPSRTVLAEALPRFRVRRSMEAYPVATARRYERVALFTLTGNIGHDLYNGLLDVFAAALTRRFDALFANVMWFTGRQSWDGAIARPDTSWSLTVVDAAQFMTEATSLHFDALQSWSGQMLVPAPHWQLALGHAGLLPDEN